MSEKTKPSSLIYRHRFLYQILMKILYGKYFSSRYQVLADLIQENASVVDLCCGDCHLYLNYLQKKSVRYTGLDISPELIKWAKEHGADAREFNLKKDTIPEADIVIMQASLYQFLPDVKNVLAKMLKAATKKVLIAEPVQNLSTHPNPILAWLGRRMTRPGAGEDYSAQRFTEKSLLDFFNSFTSFSTSRFIPGKREIIGIFLKEGQE